MTTKEEIQAYVNLGLFIVSVSLFIVVGMGAIIEVHKSMRTEFEQLKREKEELEENRRKLEEFKGKFSKLRQEKTT
jgi:prefoldin subunit 5